MLADMIERLLERHLDDGAQVRARQGEWLADIWTEVEEMGLPLALLSEAQGGFGLDPADQGEALRLLHRLQERFAIWPFDPLPERGSVLVEIYTTLAAIAAGRTAARSKMRDYAALNSALAALGSKPVLGDGALSDHAADALISAAWLRQIAHDPSWWSPPLLTPEIAAREGWTFGAR